MSADVSEITEIVEEKEQAPANGKVEPERENSEIDIEVDETAKVECKSETDENENKEADGDENKGGGGIGKDEIDILKEKLEAKTKESSENFDKFLRLNAEFDNYKKRISKEKREFYKYANEKFTGEVLEVMDNLERAITAAKQDHENTDALIKGVEMVAQQFVAILKNEGLKEIESLNKPFDPAKHEAVSQVESDKHDDNTVIEEFQKGYFFKDRILRHSKVLVSKRPKDKETNDQSNN